MLPADGTDRVVDLEDLAVKLAVSHYFVTFEKQVSWNMNPYVSLSYVLDSHVHICQKKFRKEITPHKQN